MRERIKDARKPVTTELCAGITSALAVFPLAFAFGACPFLGMPAGFGLIAAVLAGLAAFVLPQGGRILAAPACAVYLVFSACAAQYGLPVAMLASVLAGLLVLALSFGRPARLAASVARPLLAGASLGLALVMTILQTTNYFGIGATAENSLQMLFNYQSGGFHANWRTVLYGTIVLVLMITYPRKFKRFSKIVPASAVSILVTLLLNLWLNPDAAKTTVVEVGSLWNSLAVRPALFDAAFSAGMLWPLLLSTAALGAVIFLSRAAPFAVHGTNWGAEEQGRKRELRLAGVCGAVLPLFGGMPVCAGPARGKTRLTALFYTLSMLALLGLAAGCMGRLPVSSLAVILISTVWYEVDWASVKAVFRSKSSTVVLLFFVCAAATVFLRLTWCLPVFALVTFAVYFRGKPAARTRKA